jgi:Na+/melibiose symporter-like transporter
MDQVARHGPPAQGAAASGPAGVTAAGSGRAKAAAPANRLGAVQLAAWSLISLVGTMMMIPLNALIPAFYAKNTAVSLAMIGEVLLVARLYDAVVDPAVGYLSDRTAGPLGRRKPWIIAGGALACLATWLLFNPAPTAGGGYFLPVMLLFYTASSMLAAPHSAWGSELTRGYAQRSLISGVLTFAGVVGMLLVMGLPILLSSPLLPLFKTAEVTPPMLKLLGWLLVIVTPVCVFVAVTVAPSGEADGAETPSLAAVVRSVRGNRPFWIFLAGYALTGMGYGVYYATTYMFIDDYLGMADQFPLVYSISAIAQMVSIPFWTRFSQHIDRARMWALGIAGFGLILPLRLLIPHGPMAFPALVVVAVLASAANAASQVPQMAVLADCIDYQRLRGRTEVAGSYYALQNFVLKATLAAGGGLAFLALGAARFDAKARQHSPASLESLADIHTFAPLALFVLSGAILWLFPLHRDRVEVIRRRLETRAAT